MTSNNEKKPATVNSEQAKQEAMDMAEAARQTEWKDPSFAAELFAGRFRADLMRPFSVQSAEDKAIGDEYITKLQKFALEHIDADKIDLDVKYPTEVLDGLKEIGAFGMKIEKKYGGLGLSQTNYCRALEMLAGHCGSTVAFLSAHQSIGAPQPLKSFGTPEQKEKWLPQLTKKISAFALTEPSVGSDPAKMTTTATKSADGKTWTINGDKLWCTNGAIAEIIIVMCRTPDKVIKGKPRKQVTAFLVESNMPGFKVTHRCRFMGLEGIENAVIKFTDVVIPAENLIGEEGGGLRLALHTLNTGRLSLPGACIGLGKKCLEILRHWTKDRVQWGTNIGNHEEMAVITAEVAATTFAMDALTYYTCALVDKGGQDIRIEAAIAKLFCTEQSWYLTNATLQVRGGRGYERATSLKERGETPIAVERMLRDIRINTILEGSTQIMHLVVAREALDIHMKMAKALLDPRSSIGAKVKSFLTCAAFYSIWYPRQWINFGWWPLYMDMGRLGKHFRFIRRTSHKLARTTFHMMLRFGPMLEFRQLVLGRIVEVGSELFAMSAACAKADVMVKKDPTNRRPVELADIFCRQARRRIRKQFQGIWSNDDRKNVAISKDVMKGDYKWLEEGTIQGNIPY